MDYFIGTEGGTERQVFELVKGTDQNRYRPYFFTFQPMDYLHDKEFQPYVNTLNIQRLLDITSILKMLKLSFYIYKTKIDLVHIFFNDAAVLAPFFCKLGGAKVITSRRDMGFWYTPRILNALKVSNRFVDRIAVNSNAVKFNVVKMEGYPESRIKVIYNGLRRNRIEQGKAPLFRDKFNISPDHQIVGMVSNLYDVKRPKDLIQAFLEVNKTLKRVHLVFVGGGPKEIEPLKIYVDKLSINRHVHFTGKIPEPIPVIKHFDVCVSCSESEGLSNAILEYMGCGKPVVCTNVGGNPELIRNGFNGFLVDKGDIHNIADRIKAILSDCCLGKTLGEHGKQLFLSFFTSDRMIHNFMEFYDSTLQELN